MPVDRPIRKPRELGLGVISMDDAARLLGVSRRTVARQCAIYRRSRGEHGIGPVYQIGRQVSRIPVASVRAWLDRFRRAGDAPASVSPI